MQIVTPHQWFPTFLLWRTGKNRQNIFADRQQILKFSLNEFTKVVKVFSSLNPKTF